jgi:hypothetical protein
LNAADAIKGTQPQELLFLIPAEQTVLSAGSSKRERILPFGIDLLFVDIIVINVVNVKHILLLDDRHFILFFSVNLLHDETLSRAIECTSFTVEQTNAKELNILSHLNQLTFNLTFLILQRVRNVIYYAIFHVSLRLLVSSSLFLCPRFRIILALRS